MFSLLKEQNTRPPLFSRYTAKELWTDPHVAEQMMTFHLDPDVELASRSRAFMDRSLDWLTETFSLSGGAGVLDLGCGPGLYANPLAKRGARVTGVDFSRLALAHAREAAAAGGVAVDYREGNYLEMGLKGTFDLVLLIFGDFCPLSPEQRRALLSRISSWLAPGGSFVFDVTGLSHFRSMEEGAHYEWAPAGGFWSPEPYFLFTNRFVYPQESVYLDRYAIVEEGRTRTLYNWMQCFSPDTLGAELEEAGWRVEKLLGNLAGDPYDPESTFFGVVAQPVTNGSREIKEGQVKGYPFPASE